MSMADGQAAQVVTDRHEAVVRAELTHMITDLNEVHMKLDALLSRMSDPTQPETHDANLDSVRRNLDRGI